MMIECDITLVQQFWSAWIISLKWCFSPFIWMATLWHRCLSEVASPQMAVVVLRFGSLTLCSVAVQERTLAVAVDGDAVAGWHSPAERRAQGSGSLLWGRQRTARLFQGRSRRRCRHRKFEATVMNWFTPKVTIPPSKQLPDWLMRYCNLMPATLESCEPTFLICFLLPDRIGIL